ncbi:hypothetical protein WDU94_002754 [Cyamophila willieti]
MQRIRRAAPCRLHWTPIQALQSDANSCEFTSRYLNRTDSNIFLVDWSDLAQKSRYDKVAGNISSVAFDTSNAINRLFGIDFIGKLHLIGFSLGAQICGLMRKHLTRNIDRITVSLDECYSI